jgi:hypothetical protein
VLRIIALALLCAPGLAGADETPPLSWVHQYALATWEPGAALIPVLDGIAADPATRNTAMYDNVAELLSRKAGDARLKWPDSTQLITFLMRTRSGRYRDVLAAATKRIPRSKARDAAVEFVAEHRHDETPQYVPGTIDFEALRAQYLRDALAARPTDAFARQLGGLGDGTRISELFALAGAPQHVEFRHVRVSETLNFRRLLCYYRGAGRIVFGLVPDKGWVLQSVVVNPLAFELDMPYRAHATELGLPDDARVRMIQLLNGGDVGVKTAMEGTLKTQAPVSLEFLDTAAQYLSENFSPADEVADDAHAWIVRVLQERGGARYAAIITAAKRSAGSRTSTQAFAEVRKVKGITRTPYADGGISLAAQRTKYPSLYPEIQFMSGRL